MEADVGPRMVPAISKTSGSVRQVSGRIITRLTSHRVTINSIIPSQLYNQHLEQKSLHNVCRSVNHRNQTLPHNQRLGRPPGSLRRRILTLLRRHHRLDPPSTSITPEHLRQRALFSPSARKRDHHTASFSNTADSRNPTVSNQCLRRTHHPAPNISLCLCKQSSSTADADRA